ncbi:hypothetical protein LTH96_00010 [Nesterenkonia sp. LB17]|uniref:hypothetical protein n=1 Tax=unclassified Nesterenkonia TaxID=2629769 RepID=UPI001F4CCC24|nr:MULTISPECIES: hypothetical protein [unclassified Nesterenkonia]MCH8560164.1 hypothetical protein [Nesterenkonia sp. DZ6]MCH8564012.1 hypothetical protein [Nesterenkonia sp. YGD6]MCH8564123.1 hypothetical protein [Nesterenkonia sp. LB17]MCH8569752.1 hypothetical protein [Nesterenkonia sp. AY15]
MTQNSYTPESRPNTPAANRPKTDRTDHAPAPKQRRAAATGLIVTVVGVLLFNIAPFLDWVTTEDSESYSGYETDSLIPFIAYLGVGLLVALFLARGRARRGQHRGLTLVSMAVGIAAAAQCLAFAMEPMGALERGDNLSIELGVWLGLIGAAIWAIGSGLLAKEIEGDDNDRTHDHIRGAKAAH